MEVRSESFYLLGEADYPSSRAFRYEHDEEGPPRHSIIVYSHNLDEPVAGGTIEILLEDIPKIRACLDEIEAHLVARTR